MAHARCSASNAHRWTVCAGQVREAAKYPNVESAAAKEGTEAHAEAAFALENDKDSTDAAIQMYLDYVRSRPGEMFIEVPLDPGLTKLDPDMGGTADAIVIGYDVLEVIDFKYGKGVGVEAEDNEQLEIYALGALLATNAAVKTVRATIVQPRHEGMEPIRTWEFDAIDLLERAAWYAERAEATRDPNAPLVGGSHCHWCPANVPDGCPEVTRARNELMLLEFSEIVDPSKVAAALRMVPALKSQIKQLDALAYQMAVNGNPPPGFKLVEKRATRKWSDTAVVPQEFYEEVLISPAQAEKLVGKAAFRKYADFVTKQSSGYVLVQEDDKRPAITAPMSADQFDVIGGDTSSATDDFEI